MEIIIDKKRLENIALIVSNYVEKKDNTSTNSQIQLIAFDNELTLRASDTEIGIEYKIRNCNVLENGSIFINGKKFIDILKSLNNDNIKIKKLEKSIKITQNKTNFSLPIINKYDFNFIENNYEKNPILISSNELNKGFKMIVPAIDNNGTSFQFSCACIDILKNKIIFVGTDSKKLNLYTIESNNDNEDRIIITKKSILELMKLLNEEVKVYKNKTYFIIENDNFMFYTKLALIDYLPYKDVIPQREPTQLLKLNNESFLNEIKKLSAVSMKTELTFENNKIIFKNNSIDGNDLNETNVVSELEINSNIDETFEINLTNKYMMDFLNLNENENFDFKFFAKTAPVIFESKNFMSIITVNKN
ncbi:DNA polymerase III subunit beta [Campylobacter sp. MG1]|uniref:DNA polymerase III subunit beta n=1 Tax=Campylobacter sp. MG1 TaxID=2976332 RepID=UPI00226CACBB|nr:DNA polymerase III subunit beta [Campylobacter sp. MG1]